MVVRPFFAHVDGSQAYLEGELARHQPDLVILTVTTFPFAHTTIEAGFRQRFGDRAGGAYHRVASGLDEATRNRGPLARSINRGSRALAKRLLPSGVSASYAAALDGTLTAIRCLARLEQVDAIVFHGFVRVPTRTGGALSAQGQLIRSFLAAVSATAAEVRIPFLNMQQRAGGIPANWYMPDGLHVTPQAHQEIAATLLRSLREMNLMARTEAP